MPWCCQCGKSPTDKTGAERTVTVAARTKSGGRAGQGRQAGLQRNIRHGRRQRLFGFVAGRSTRRKRSSLPARQAVQWQRLDLVVVAAAAVFVLQQRQQRLHAASPLPAKNNTASGLSARVMSDVIRFFAASFFGVSQRSAQSLRPKRREHLESLQSCATERTQTMRPRGAKADVNRRTTLLDRLTISFVACLS